MATPAVTALADQIGAAVTDAVRLHTQIGHHQGITPHQLSTPHPWLTRQVHTLVDTLRTGNGRLCPHIGPAPLVLYGAAWAPGHLVCPRCIAALRPDDTEDSTCDRCRRPATPIYAGMAQSGLLLLAYGLCRRCARRTGLGPTNLTHTRSTDSSTPNYR
ncbi:hypothetical protein [Sphaerisporangium aureirubrum]|uniref:Uncharacterized protein n=1 Tax=Sphaerisporangium aureirubrum TaxID=1544736 RepID=A0ABW1ND84_9ACTN